MTEQAQEERVERSRRSILDVRGVSKRFGGIKAVERAEFSVAEGSITALIGPNGAGKTTLFNVITGFYAPDEGEISYLGRAIAGLAPYQVARLGAVRTFQVTKALSGMSVLDNLLVAAPTQPGERLRNLVLRPAAARRRESQIRDEALALLETFDLGTKADDYAATLSGGQRKLLELASALMARPRLVLLDEPMAGVNRSLGRRLLDYIERVRREQGTTFLLIEHDMDVVMNRSDRVVVMAQGRVISEGSPAEVREDDRVVDAYLGREEVSA